MKNLKVNAVIYVLLTFLILLSSYLTYVHAVGEDVGICLVNQDGKSSCSDVQNTAYGSFLGIKVCHWGLTAFIILFITYLTANTKNKYQKQASKLFVLLTLIGSIIALYFIYIQFFVLKTLCPTCLIIDFSIIIIFALAYAEFHIKKRSWYSI